MAQKTTKMQVNHKIGRSEILHQKGRTMKSSVTNHTNPIAKPMKLNQNAMARAKFTNNREVIKMADKAAAAKLIG